jgi:hypothetical protein
MTDDGLLGSAIDWLRASPNHALWFFAAGFGSVGAALALLRWRATHSARPIKNK